MNRRNPYNVPPDYFDKLETSIINRIEGGELNTEQQPPISWGHAWRQMIGFAAGFALLVGIGWLFVWVASDGKTPNDPVAEYRATIDTARFVWVMSEEEIVAIVDHKTNHSTMAKAVAEYIAFYGEADDVNLIYYD